MSTILYRIVNTTDNIRVLSVPSTVEHAHWHDLSPPRDAGHTLMIIANRRNQAANERAVYESGWRGGTGGGGLRIIIVLNKIPASRVVNVTVAIIINTIKHLTGIHPEVGGNIRVIETNAGVEHRNHYLTRTGRHIPCSWRVDFIEIPLIDIKGVVWGERKGGLREK